MTENNSDRDLQAVEESPKPGKRSRIVKRILKIALAATAAALVAGAVYNLIFPNIARLRTENPEQTAMMKYRLKQSKNQRRPAVIRQSWVPLSRISPYLVHAVVIAEDDKFWTHGGFDFQAIWEALKRNLKQRTLRYGGSSITQQLAKNLFLSPSRNPFRKVREAFITWRLERRLTKKRIMELYLNVVEWGNGIYGCEAAARHFFQKSAADLSPDEAARLAVVLPSPRRYNPLADTRYINGRVQDILTVMAKRGLVSLAEEKEQIDR